VLNRRGGLHTKRDLEAIPHRGRYAPYEWWHPLHMLELNDVTHASSRALRLRGASPVLVRLRDDDECVAEVLSWLALGRYAVCGRIPTAEP
jgi:hypothetical protein